MPRPKKPSALKELNGSARHDPQRVNKNEPKPVRGIGPAPSHFTEGMSDTWDYLVSVMCPGVLGESDRPTLELLAVLFHRFRYGSYEEDAPLRALAVGELARMDSIMGRYGMTPSDRQKIVVPKEEAENPFETLQAL